MNDRIRGLEKQATEIVRCGLNGTSTAEVFDRKKFAELIVKECIKTIEEQFTRHSVTRSVRNTDYNIGLSTAVEAIEEHFGVTE